MSLTLVYLTDGVTDLGVVERPVLDHVTDLGVDERPVLDHVTDLVVVN